MSQPDRGPRLRVVGLSLCLAAAAALGCLLLAVTLDGPGPVTRSPDLPWWVFFAAFATTELFVLHVQVRREARTVSLSEVPLVLGLFLLPAVALVAVRVAGAVAVFVLHRRQGPLKLLFNSSLMLFDVVLALVVFHAVLGDGGAVLGDEGLGPRGWLATYLATTLAGAASALGVTAVIALYERQRPDAADVRHALVSGAPGSAVVATAGLVTLLALHADPRAGALILVLCATVLVSYRAYAGLAERHLNLERLYRFTQAVSRTPEVDGVLRSVLDEARALLRSERAEIVFLADGGRAALRVGIGAGRALERTEVDRGLRSDPVARAVVADGEPVLLPRGTRSSRRREWLRQRGLRDAAAVPMRGDVGVVGVLLVADRLGDVRTFDEEDLRLLETVAAHASVALENSRLVDRLRHEAMHDGLTGLPNRGFLHRAGDDALAAVAEGEADGCALMVMDLDGFKQVNDTLGHLHGDLLLREVANRLLDAVPSGAVVARLGGDEFAVLLPDCDSESVALATAGRVLASLERPARVDDLELEVGASIGLALAPQHGTEMGVLLKRADAAMYSAKGSGRGTCTFADDLEEGGRTRLVLASELRQGLLRGELVVHGQPQAELGSGRVTGVEVLVRWQHPSRGLLYPDDFLPVAERAGLLRPLTQQVLEAGVRACATWSAAGHDLVVAVNLSARTLHDPSLVDDVLRLLDEHAVPAARLTLEITENSVMSDLAGTTEVLERLRAAGVRVSVDDFGTGYSSLSYLSRLPVDEVKVDKHFVLGMSRDAHDAAIVRSVIDLGANLGLAVVAEGVEDARTWATLADLGCTTGQGFWLAPGMDLDDLLPWLEARAAGGPRTPVRQRGGPTPAGARSV